MGLEARASVRRLPIPSPPRPMSVLVAAAALTAIVSVAALVVEGRDAVLFDNLQQLIATVGGLGMVTFAVRRADRGTRFVPLALAGALSLAALGHLAWNVAPWSPPFVATAGDVVFAASALVGVAGVLPAIFGGLDRDGLLAIGADALILFFTGVALAAAIVDPEWLTAGHQPGVVALIGAVGLLVVSGACVAALVIRRVVPRPCGPWALIAGVSVTGTAWLLWLGDGPGAELVVAPSDFLYSIGILLIAYGGATWDVRAPQSATFDRYARVVGMGLPVTAFLLSTAVIAWAQDAPGDNVVSLAFAGVALSVVARQGVLLASERRAVDAERRASERLEREIRERAETIVSLSRLRPEASPEETARAICSEALRLDGIDVALVSAISPDGEVVALALEGADIPDLVGRPYPAQRAAHIVSRATSGPWVERFDDAVEDGHLARVRASGLCATANTALHWNGDVIGSIGLGTKSAEIAADLEERLPTVREFAVVTAGLIGPALAERKRVRLVRSAIQAIIDREAFRPVFQPVVHLASGETVGYEALTRFHDGAPPDFRFAEATSAGIGVELEAACLRSGVAAARGLPRGAWLSVNVSPALASDLVTLIEALERLDRDVVIEITEHVPVEDYARLAEALQVLSGHARIAVDDAGSGYAGLKHILEVHPHFVKLDIALVRGIDADPARRAMVAAMGTFARETGCRIIAEGIEREGELAVLRELGIAFGQGYLLGRPARVEDAAAASSAGAESRVEGSPGEVDPLAA